MPKTYPGGFYNSQTRCLLVKVVRGDGVIFGYTDHDQAIVWSGVTYQPIDGMLASVIQQDAGTGSDNFTLTTLPNPALARITVGDLAASIYNKTRIWVYETDWVSIPANPPILCQYRLAKAQVGDTLLQLEIADLLSLLKNPVGDTFEQDCIVLKVWNKRCDPSQTLAALFTFARTVTNVNDAFSFDVSDGHTIPYYSFGYGKWTAGANNGVDFDVLRETNPSGGVIRVFLRTPMGYAVQVGDTLNLTRGCDKKKSTCKTIPNAANATGTNIENFQSVELPSPDLIRAVGRQSGG